MKPFVSNVRFVVHPLTKGSRLFLDEEEKFQEKLLRLSESTFSAHNSDLPPVLKILQQQVISDCAVGPNHLSFLLDDGRVCRVGYTAKSRVAHSEKTSEDLPKEKNQQNSRAGTRMCKSMRTSSDPPWALTADFLGMGSSGSWSRWGNRIGVVRSTTSSSGTTTAVTTSARKTTRGSTNSTSISSSSIRLIRTGQVRGRNLPLMSSGQRAILSAQVPEDLINQVQNVLQGKSRNVIIRELQRTSLDVNLAVNNLLSRDDEDNDDMDDADYIHGEELMSLFEGAVNSGDHPRVVIDAETMLPEDLLGYTFPSRTSTQQRGLGGSSDRNADKEEPDEESSKQGSSNWSEAKNSDSAQASKPQTKPIPGSSVDSGLTLGSDIEWWMDGDEPVKFKLIGAMHSELTGVDLEGCLRQWKWSSEKPYHETNFHPRTEFLELGEDKISFLATSSIRASVVTEGGAVATWMDETVCAHTGSLESPRQPSDSLRNEKVKSLCICPLYSAVLTEAGRVYWWGILPFSQRKKLLEKSQNNLLQNTEKSEISVGSQVCLRSLPSYHAGSIAINTSSGEPRVGRLLEVVWSLEKKCSFKILSSSQQEKENEKQLEPKSETSLLDSCKPGKRKRDSSVDKEENKEEENTEQWDLREVVFVEDVKSVPIGKVEKVDGNIVAVNFSSDNPGNRDSSLQSCRLLHKDDVVIVKTQAPRMLDCLQKTPRKLQCDPQLKLHCISAMETGITAVANKMNNNLGCIHLSLTSGKVTSRRRFPTKIDSFLPTGAELPPGMSSLPGPTQKPNKTKSCKLLNKGQEYPSLLVDYNSMVYPLLGDENGGIKDPIWADIPPLFASGMGVHSENGSNKMHAVTVLAFRNHVLMPLVLRRDRVAFESLISSVESNQAQGWIHVFNQSLCEEKCDGQRNLLHMCIEMTIPSSNKEQKADEKERKTRSPKPPVKFPDTSPTTRGMRCPEPSSSRETPSGSMYMSNDDRMEAVNAIANAISLVNRSSPQSSRNQSEPVPRPAQRPASGGQSGEQRSDEGQPGSSDSSGRQFSSLNTFMDFYSRAHGLLGELVNPEVSPPQSPVLTWPPELPSYWKSVADNKDGDQSEGMNLSTSDAGKSKSSWSEFPSEMRDRGTRGDAVAILKLLCKSKSLQPFIKTLLTLKDASGYTPFMFAVAHRAYTAAQVLFQAALDIAKDASDETNDKKEKPMIETLNDDDINNLMPMLYPAGSHPDDNPLYMLCCNDTCSFTWTGIQHINQDIFECLTCGLTESLCCCTECARVCHKGHDCKLKRTNPTAYCDCWEKCACKSLVAGDNTERTALLRTLIYTTKLYEKPDSSGQHIMQFLIQTIARQLQEHGQYRPPNRSARITLSTSRTRVSHAKSPQQDQDWPEHDLRPPQFCQGALLLLLDDWKSLRSLILSGCDSRRDNQCMSSQTSEDRGTFYLLPEDEKILDNQTGTSRLDIFTHTLLVKCPNAEFVDKLLETLIHSIQTKKGKQKDESIMVARRFLRSVIRIYIVLTAQLTPEKVVTQSTLYHQPLYKCRIAFMALLPLAAEELCETAESLIAPVRMGVARPTTPFPLVITNSDVTNGSSTAFSRLPFPPRSGASDDEDQDQDEQQKISHHRRRKRGRHSKRGGSRRFGSRRTQRAHEASSEVRDRSEEVTAQSSSAAANEAGNDHPDASQENEEATQEADTLEITQGSMANDGEPHEDSRDVNMDDEDEENEENNRGEEGVRESEERGEEEDDEDDEDEEERESDMDLSDFELCLPDSDSESAASNETYQVTRSRRRDHESQDKDDDDSEENDEEDTDSDHWEDEVPLERQATRQLRDQARQAPHAMQWAMESNSTARIKSPNNASAASSSRATGGLSGVTSPVMYFNSRSVGRRENLQNAYISTILDRHRALNNRAKPDEARPNSSAVTNAQLSRLFGICMREISHLVSVLRKGDYLSEAPLSTVLEISFKESTELRNFIEQRTEATWQWLRSVVSATEAQLRYGQVLSIASSPAHPEHPNYKRGEGKKARDVGRHSTNMSEETAARQDFLSYALSLMRSHTNEHSDLLPIVDVSALKHIAYVLDAYIFYLRGLSYKNTEGKKTGDSSRHSISLDIGYDNSENDEEDDDFMNFPGDLYSVAIQQDASSTKSTEDSSSSLSQPPQSFFRRSESMDFLGESEIPNLFEIPLPVALPLAEKPHLLQPTARKEDLFGRPRIDSSHSATSSMGLSSRVASVNDVNQEKEENKDQLSEESSKKKQIVAESSTLGSSNFSPVLESVESSSVDPETQSTSTSIPGSSENNSSGVKSSIEEKEAPSTSDDPTSITDAMIDTAPDATVTVDVTTYEATSMDLTMEENMKNNSSMQLSLSSNLMSADVVLQQSRLTLELFSKVFLEDVGAEPKSILHELGGFEVRESKFRKMMEKLRTGHSIDLQLNVERPRDSLIRQTFKQLNQHFKRRCGSSQPMAVVRVKVIFKNEPGEGTGVARSFYTAICEALLSSERLPLMDGVLPGKPARMSATTMHPMLVARLYKSEREREQRTRTGSPSSGGMGTTNLRSYLSARYRERNAGGRRVFTTSGPTPLLLSAPPYFKKSSSRANRAYERSKQAIGERLYPKVMAIHPVWVPKITGMLLGLPAYELLLLLRSERNLYDRVHQAASLLDEVHYDPLQDDNAGGTTTTTGRQESAAGQGSRPGSATGESRNDSKLEEKKALDKKGEEASVNEEVDGGPPLFFQPGKRGMYAPTSWGEMTDTRLNAYRNVGRILGLCLLQNELSPLPLCRHVLKVILNRKVNWHDLAFFDPTLYESLRQLVLDGESEDGGVLDALELTFSVDLQPEEGGQQVSLIPDGDAIPVTKSNVRDYVRRYALQRMLVCCKKPLEKIRQGVYDVLPKSALQSITAEDLRLLANGCGHVGVHTLISYTLFNDESGKNGTSAEKLTQFKRWFWSVVDRFSAVERQELLYFWTGSPALPASEDGFQPMPTITIRPPDDHHLPTANTCISRLYVPLYSSRKILRHKLGIAIKTKNFGFV
uniref:E3 ubiquitin-protein ligase UBR5 isoform X2 n=1 Tax=Ciona intestinalis TaxID=7719 RepID=UPI00089DB609|nr:E3 ubiquitin-protein ligase UBR5 isoform X2 [Ciona intestinalis]|eukprot:XP_018673161.1 E3 ubiquitin-protein ligase UBR5 isoform X2 [Ciona intestinalis]